MGVLIDSNFYLALVHPQDPYAKKAEAILLSLLSGSYGLIFTSNLVISEAVTLTFIRTKGNKLILNDLHQLIWGEDQLAIRLKITDELERETWNQFIKFNQSKSSKKGFLSFVDVSLIVLAKNNLIEHILSFDSHFDGFISRLY